MMLQTADILRYIDAYINLIITFKYYSKISMK